MRLGITLRDILLFIWRRRCSIQAQMHEPAAFQVARGELLRGLGTPAASVQKRYAFFGGSA
jgi:hypothetical protein